MAQDTEEATLQEMLIRVGTDRWWIRVRSDRGALPALRTCTHGNPTIQQLADAVEVVSRLPILAQVSVEIERKIHSMKVK